MFKEYKIQIKNRRCQRVPLVCTKTVGHCLGGHCYECVKFEFNDIVYKNRFCVKAVCQPIILLSIFYGIDWPLVIGTNNIIVG